jgi:hypothetical protein
VCVCVNVWYEDRWALLCLCVCECVMWRPLDWKRSFVRPPFFLLIHKKAASPERRERGRGEREGGERERERTDRPEEVAAADLVRVHQPVVAQALVHLLHAGAWGWGCLLGCWGVGVRGWGGSQPCMASDVLCLYFCFGRVSFFLGGGRFTQRVRESGEERAYTQERNDPSNRNPLMTLLLRGKETNQSLSSPSLHHSLSPLLQERKRPNLSIPPPSLHHSLFFPSSRSPLLHDALLGGQRLDLLEVEHVLLHW